MTEDLKEFDKLIREKNISDVDKMLEESKKLTANIPNLEERHQKVIVARGNVIEASIKVEMAFDELLTKTGGEDLVLDHEKKEFHLITGAKKENELGSLGFKRKIQIIREIVKKSLNEPSQSPKPNLLDDLDRFVAIRDLFAHVPVSWFAQELEFDDNPRYKHFFKIDQRWKDLSFAVKEFMGLQSELLEFIPLYIKSVLLKRELFSNIFLGSNYNEFLEKYKKDHKDEKKID